jgi:hypothetical protein
MGWAKAGGATRDLSQFHPVVAELAQLKSARKQAQQMA